MRLSLLAATRRCCYAHRRRAFAATAAAGHAHPPQQPQKDYQQGAARLAQLLARTRRDLVGRAADVTDQVLEERLRWFIACPAELRVGKLPRLVSGCPELVLMSEEPGAFTTTADEAVAWLRSGALCKRLFSLGCVPHTDGAVFQASWPMTSSETQRPPPNRCATFIEFGNPGRATQELEKMF